MLLCNGYINLDEAKWTEKACSIRVDDRDQCKWKSYQLACVFRSICDGAFLFLDRAKPTFCNRTKFTRLFLSINSIFFLTDGYRYL